MANLHLNGEIYRSSMNFPISNLVFRAVKKIPMGKVSTYGAIADRLRREKGRINGHLVGWILHRNKDPQVPCHRVVDRTGRLAPNFGFEGEREQKRRLEEEGVTFTDERHVDLKKHLWIQCRR